MWLLLLGFFCQLGWANFFYPASYEEGRQHFTELVAQQRAKGFKVLSQDLSIPGNNDQELTINTAYFPQVDQTRKLIIITSGVHGIEAFAGSAILNHFMANLTAADLQQSGFLFIHGVNPWGFKHRRRVTENNVDLNRNFLVEPGQYATENRGYRQFNELLNPTTKLKYSWWQKVQMFFKIVTLGAVNGFASFRQAVLLGQYQFQRGIFFGGQGAEPNVLVVRDLLRRIADPYPHIFHLDLHTGFGTRGTLHLFSSNPIGHEPDQLDHAIFKDLQVDFGDDKNFYQVHGDITQHTLALFRDKQVAAMTYEFGTQDSDTLLGSYFSLRTVVWENQGFHAGYFDQQSEQNVKKDFAELFNPADLAWRQNMITDANHMFNLMKKRFVEFHSQ